MTSHFSTLLYVAIGGAVGAVARHGVYQALGEAERTHAAWTTFLINVAGCLALGVILGWSAARGPIDERVRAFLAVGVLGAFTTFSTYAGDALRLLGERRGAEAALYMVLSASIGLAACALGAWATQKLAS